MNRVPEPPPSEPPGRFVPGPPDVGVAQTSRAAGVAPLASKRGTPVWAVIVIMVEATVLACMVAGVAILALFGDQLAEKVGGTAATVGAGAAPLASSSAFYYLLDSHNYQLAHEALASDLASEYTTERLREEWKTLEEAEGRTLPLPTNVQLKGNRATVSLLLSAARTNRTFSVQLTLEQGPDETWYIVEADPLLVPKP